jgi:hypothetical protein
MQGLPGVRVNVNEGENEDEIWLAVKRLHEMKPPDITSPVLRPWVQMTQSPNEELRLREATDGASLIAAGTHYSSATPPEQGKPAIDPKATVILSDYDKAEQVRAQLATYLDTRWRPWGEEEKLRRKTIRLYSQLFTLKQQLEGGIVEAQLELVWGVGVGIWSFDGTAVNYPVVGRLVEVSLSPETAEVEIRPRDVDARLEIDWYASVDNPGVADLGMNGDRFIFLTCLVTLGQTAPHGSAGSPGVGRLAAPRYPARSQSAARFSRRRGLPVLPREPRSASGSEYFSRGAQIWPRRKSTLTP